MNIASIHLYQIAMPLTVPYVVSRTTFSTFTPILMEVRASHGESGWGEALITPGYTRESVEGGWQFCREQAAAIIGVDANEACSILTPRVSAHPCAASAMISALEMLLHHPSLVTLQSTRFPLLAPCQETDVHAIYREVEYLIGKGFQTLKVKAGFDVDADLARLRVIHHAVAGRATLRIDANCGFSREEGVRYAEQLDLSGIELLEQPCGTQAWDDNAVVASLSPVPVMLDESIYGMADIDRAASIPGVGYVKLKLKKTGGATLLRSSLERIRSVGLLPVLGDGVSTEIGCWMEACVGRGIVTNAGEMNGFLKTVDRLFVDPLPVEQGSIAIPAGYWPEVNRKMLDAHVTRREAFGR